MITLTAPEYLGRSTHTGRWTRTFSASARYAASAFTAGELATMHAGEFAIWESAGHMRDGRELFCLSRFVPQADGSLVGYDADGRRIIVHPAERSLRILTR
jgi:hypothetical protein